MNPQNKYLSVKTFLDKRINNVEIFSKQSGIYISMNQNKNGNVQ